MGAADSIYAFGPDGQSGYIRKQKENIFQVSGLSAGDIEHSLGEIYANDVTGFPHLFGIEREEGACPCADVEDRFPILGVDRGYEKVSCLFLEILRVKGDKLVIDMREDVVVFDSVLSYHGAPDSSVIISLKKYHCHWIWSIKQDIRQYLQACPGVTFLK